MKIGEGGLTEARVSFVMGNTVALTTHDTTGLQVGVVREPLYV